MSSYYISIFYVHLLKKDFFANAHAFFVKPLITNRTYSHKVINTIFRISHQNVSSAYTKNINVSLKNQQRGTLLEIFGKGDNSCSCRHSDK